MEDLVQILKDIPIIKHPNLLVGTETGDDAAVYRINDHTALILTVDFFPPITDDPFQFGEIAAANSLSDVYAMGGTPLVAMNIVGFPAELDKEILSEILKGGYSKAAEAQCLIVGGHTVDDPEPKYGLSVVGTVEPGKQITNAGAQPGDVLILTKPLGSGIITTAGKQGICPPEVLQEACTTMATLNKSASQAMTDVGVHSATDVTGFGLMGHLQSMIKGSGVSAEITLSSVPAISGVWDLLEQGVAPGGTHRNLQSVSQSAVWHPDLNEKERLFLCDAQTSGGLLISVAEDKGPDLISALQANSTLASIKIGKIIEDTSNKINVTP